MKNVRFITRADDAGSSRSANAAIAKVLKAGFIKNVSVMAPGAYVDDAAQMLAGSKDTCFGMHTTLNAEWDRVKWGPVSQLPADSGLTDAQGYFLANPSMFLQTKPPVELVMREVAAQLDKLTRAGFDIRYIDSHMLAEQGISGMDDAMRDFAKAKGLLDHMYYYNVPAALLQAVQQNQSLIKTLRTLPPGQYFYLAHPALDMPEMRMTGNSKVRGEDVAKSRAAETKMLSMPGIRLLMRALGVTPLRYDEATPLDQRLTLDDIKNILGGTT